MKVDLPHIPSPQIPVAAEENALIDAVNSGDLQKLKELLRFDNSKIAAKAEGGTTVLMHAASLNRVEMMELIFLECGVDLNERNDAGETALMQAVMNESHDATNWLVKHGAEVNIMDNSGCTALLKYIHSLAPSAAPRKEVVNLFVNAYLDFDAPDADGRTALMLLASRPGSAKYKFLTAMAGRPGINAIDKNGCTALHIAAECRDYKFGAKLVQSGVWIHTVANDGRSALDAAKDAASNEADRAFVNYLQAAENLQKNQALILAGEQRRKVLEQHRLTSMADDSDADRDNDSWGGMVLNSVVHQQLFWPARFETDFSEMSYIRTPLLSAVVARDRERISHILKNESPNIDVRGPSGWTPLMHAATGEGDFLRFLLDELDKYKVKFDLNLVNDFNESALIVAASKGNAENMKILLQRDSGMRPDVNIADRYGGNALMIYIVHCREQLDADLVGLLLGEKLNVAWQCKTLQTVAMILVGATGSAAKERFLKAPGVVDTLDMLDERKASALMYAVMAGDYDYFKLLIAAGASIDLQSEGYSARTLAKESGQTRFLEFIDRIAGRAEGETPAGRPVARMADGD